MQQWERYLKSIYFNPKHAGGFSSANKLFKAVQREGKYNIKLGQIKRWLSSVDAYTMSRPVVRRMDKTRRRNKIQVLKPFELWDADLMDLKSHAKVNDGYAYVLVVIDVFSRFLYTRPLKTKKISEIKVAFEEIIQEAGQSPSRCRTDMGHEFTGKAMEHYFQEKNIHHYVTNSEGKASFAERVIQTVKRMMFRYMIHMNKLRWIDVLEHITTNYNNTYHTSINMAPKEVNSENQDQVWANQYLIPALKQDQKQTKLCLKKEVDENKKPLQKKKKKKQIVYKFKIGDHVRISFKRGSFERVFSQKFSGEIFRVAKRYTRQDVPVYRLEDLKSELLEGSFYQNELQKVTFDENKEYKVEKILKSRKVRGKKEVLVRWLHWPPKFDEWIPATDVRNVTDMPI